VTVRMRVAVRAIRVKRVRGDDVFTGVPLEIGVNESGQCRGPESERAGEADSMRHFGVARSRAPVMLAISCRPLVFSLRGTYAAPGDPRI
jgi:hypothetical protein